MTNRCELVCYPHQNLQHALQVRCRVEAYIHTMIQWCRFAEQVLTVYILTGPVRLLMVLKSYDFGSHSLEQSEPEGAVQFLVERERREEEKAEKKWWEEIDENRR